MARQRASSVTKLRLLTTVNFSLLSIAVIIAGCELLPRPPAPTSADYCNVKTSPADPGDELLEVWAPAPRQHCLRLYSALFAARELEGISVVAVEKNINVTPYRALIDSAAKEQSAPDMAFFRNSYALSKLADAGYLYPMKNCNLHDEDWTSPIFQQRTWSYPFELEVHMLFYSKRILRKLGWDNATINKLPADIANGTFSLDDLLSIAMQAVDTGAVDKGFAFTVHDSRFYSAMHIFKSLGGRYSDDPEHLSHNKDALTKTYKYYEQFRDYRLMHPAISQTSYANISNRLAIRDALANGRILFSHTAVSEWKRMLLDHVQNETQLRANVGIALFPASNTRGSVMMSALGSYVIFSEKATGKANQAASCKVIRAIANSDLHRQHATNTSQVAPETDGIWTPSILPSIGLEILHHSYRHHSSFSKFVGDVNNVTALLAKAKISAEQAVALTLQQLQTSAQ